MRKERKTKDLPLEVIERGLKDSDWRVRVAAMNACNGKDVPLEVIERWLKDSDCDVRAAAMKYLDAHNMPVPVIRTIEPPEKVYKQCLSGVVVVAHIPDDAEVRGKIGGKCRTNKAVITDIIGNCCGEKIGISLYDGTTCYFVGDEVEIDDFDIGYEECSRGFHFFCTLEEAKNYIG